MISTSTSLSEWLGRAVWHLERSELITLWSEHDPAQVPLVKDPVTDRFFAGNENLMMGNRNKQPATVPATFRNRRQLSPPASPPQAGAFLNNIRLLPKTIRCRYPGEGVRVVVN